MVLMPKNSAVIQGTPPVGQIAVVRICFVNSPVWLVRKVQMCKDQAFARTISIRDRRDIARARDCTHENPYSVADD